MNISRLLGALCAVAVAFTCSVSNAALITYTDQSTFNTALPGTASTLDFDSLAMPTTINSGVPVDGITFTYNFGGTSMVITDGDQFGGGGPFDTTSGGNFLGTNDSDIFLDDDDFTMSFSSVSAIGMYFITAEVPDTSIFDNDIQLTASTATALLDVSAIQQTLSDGALVYFLGIIDTTGTFTTASIDTPNTSGAFLYNIDDITTSVSTVPLPSTLWLFISGLAGLLSVYRKSQSASS